MFRIQLQSDSKEENISMTLTTVGGDKYVTLATSNSFSPIKNLIDISMLVVDISVAPSEL